MRVAGELAEQALPNGVTRGEASPDVCVARHQEEPASSVRASFAGSEKLTHMCWSLSTVFESTITVLDERQEFVCSPSREHLTIANWARSLQFLRCETPRASHSYTLLIDSDDAPTVELTASLPPTLPCCELYRGEQIVVITQTLEEEKSQNCSTSSG
ncbi:hypothetical protein AXG93_2931s1570 [Marchantia polymorpha subsp. ruderalis]|uniref:Uncharacterized protein n=1 Tax=Marchantia polymorpha subsp. ruderalis TaxID=1480154 RepID=A0A176VVT0_MARPO|nr:hypothetical protein AXG93_2931s1570 [Marchantia polymorpha subsp. ruderalis]